MPTKISWTGETWNPTVGCARVSEGCRNCYAEHAAAMVNRTQGERSPYRDLIKLTGGRRRDPQWTGRAKFLADRLAIPFGWQKPRRVFVDSMSDLFHADITNEQIAAVFGAMAATPRHTYQILTKRPARMVEWFRWVDGLEVDQWTECHAAAIALDDGAEAIHRRSEEAPGRPWPLRNVWLGVSVENQAAADERIPLLLQTPAAVRFISAEPLLGPVDLVLRGTTVKGWDEDWKYDTLRGVEWASPRDDKEDGTSPSLDWVIAGCESGAGARPCDVAWLRSLRDQCEAAGVPFFLKQAVEQAHPDFGELGPALPRPVVNLGAGSHRKGRGHGGSVIELPYLDGVQHAAFPEVADA